MKIVYCPTVCGVVINMTNRIINSNTVVDSLYRVEHELKS